MYLRTDPFLHCLANALVRGDADTIKYKILMHSFCSSEGEAYQWYY